MRDSFIFYRSFFEAIDNLPQENQTNIYKAIAEFSLNNKEIELNGVEKTVFILIKPQLEANNKKYINGTKEKKQKISKTEAKNKQNRSKTEAKNKQNRSKTQGNVNVNVNVNDNVNDNDNININKNINNNVKENNIKEIAENFRNSWNNFAKRNNLPTVIKELNEDNIKKLSARLKECDGYKNLCNIIKDNWNNSEFIRGENNAKFVFNLTFILQKKSFSKMMNKEYYDRDYFLEANNEY